MKRPIPKITKDKIMFAWHWQCLHCGEENSYSVNRCKCREVANDEEA